MNDTIETCLSLSGKSEAVIIIKASPNASQKHGETVCCAAIDSYKRWLRLYPVSFRHLDEARKFSRWDRVRFSWRKPKDDHRTESRRVDQQTLEIVGSLHQRGRSDFLSSLCVDSLKSERAVGRSLALLRPEILSFDYKRKSEEDIGAEKSRFDVMRSQGDLLSSNDAIVPYKPCPFRFSYRYRDADGTHEGTCQDWETETTFFNWSRDYGEANALSKMRQVFGVDYPKRGMVLAMGTHSRRPDQWLVNGVVRLDEAAQGTLL